jgi:hypothetical protein
MILGVAYQRLYPGGKLETLSMVEPNDVLPQPEDDSPTL